MKEIVTSAVGAKAGITPCWTTVTAFPEGERQREREPVERRGRREKECDRAGREVTSAGVATGRPRKRVIVTGERSRSEGEGEMKR